MMLENMIIPSGEKVKRLRRLMGLNQEDLTGGKITRNLISYVENRKARLTLVTAEIIAEAMNNSGRNKGILVTTEYLLEDELSQAHRILGDIIEAMESSMTKGDIIFAEELRRAEEILEEWDIPHRKIKIYELAGDWYFKKGQYDKSYLYNMRIFESLTPESDALSRSEVIVRLARCAYSQENYQESIMLNNYAVGMIRDGSDERYFNIYKRALFNKALAYKRLKEHELCLVELGKLELKEDCLSLNEKVDISILKGSCYLHKKELAIALEIYQGLLKGPMADFTIDRILNIYNNTSVIYIGLQEHEKALEYLYLCYKNIPDKFDIKKLDLTINDILLGIAKTYMQLNKYVSAEKHLLMLKKSNIKEQNLLVLIKTYGLLCRVYCETEKEEALIHIVNEVVALLNNNQLSDGEKACIERLFFENSYYFAEKDPAYSRRLLKLGLSIQENT